MKSLARIFGLVAMVIAGFGLLGSIGLLFSPKYLLIPLFYLAMGAAGFLALRYGTARRRPPPVPPRA